MALFGYHASHEQFAPEELRDLVLVAEDAGFDLAKCSDHFQPFSHSQGQSGFAFSWIAACLQATGFPIGMITTPGHRYHPVIVAQAAATLGAMFPGRFWLALGSGEAVNESVIGKDWPEKSTRNQILAESAAVIRALLRGEVVTHYGAIAVKEARLFSRPLQPVQLFGAAITAQTAAFVAPWADGLLTVGGEPQKVAKVVSAFRDNGGAGKPVHIQHALSWATDDATALAEARHQWAPVVAAGMQSTELPFPRDFDRLALGLSDDALREAVVIASDIGCHVDRLAALAELGDVVHLHHVGRNQRAFLHDFAPEALAQLRAGSARGVGQPDIDAPQA